MIAVGSILAVIGAQLFVSLLVTHSAYTVDSLQNRQTQVQRQYQVVSEALARDSSPQNLAARAHALGMVSGSNLVYLRLSDGAVLGTPQAAKKVAAGSPAASSLVPDALVPGLDSAKRAKKTTPAARQGTTSGDAASGQSAPRTARQVSMTRPAGPVSIFTGTLASPVTR
jgi:hypothetical protein